ncbi:hypothetical protein MUO56_01915 [Candidatus Bathyarchaeota archaeon]|nr:hypothetical protein [Candidatus Bathyarchaeota archaeon]
MKRARARDLVEPFRPYIIHFLLQYSKTLEPNDFKRTYIKNKLPRYFLTHETTWTLIEALNKQLFEAYIPQQRNRNIGFKMQFETLIDEYVSSIAKTINSPILKIAETTFPKPLLYHEKQWATSSSPSFLDKPQHPARGFRKGAWNRKISKET